MGNGLCKKEKKGRYFCQVLRRHLPDFVLEDGVGLNVDGEGDLAELELVAEHRGEALFAEIEKLENVVAGGENDLERVVVLRLPPCKLTRLVQEACKRVHCVVLRQHAVRPS